ncbi:VOC family protein [Mobilicoccus massiliensis]|uniref:VOC family protein n=1 Tax=Mobilicoccus massiliensis TaxID=1522310 RepID=UPI0006950841|nr:VOC family protein [Mobilicoccus massiliensis]
MTARTTPQTTGTPTWLDFWCSDIDATRTFWIDLLDYTIPEGTPEFGGYTVAQKDDRYVFGIGPAMPEAHHDEAAMYFATDDIDATLARIPELGGRVVMERTEIPDTGAMAVAVDPAGVMFAPWQAGGTVGYGAVDEPGFPCWQDCITSNIEKSSTFYGELFGFTFEPMGPGGVVLAKLGDDGHFTVGQCPDQGEPHWVTYLLVDDVDAMTTKAAGLGASVDTQPTDLPFGRFAHLSTPGGAPFGLFTGNDEQGS